MHPSNPHIVTKSDKRIYAVAATTVIILALCAAILSYSALMELAVQSGISHTLAYLFPITIDGLILSGSLLILFAANRGKRSWGGFFLTGLGVVSSIAGNVAVSPTDTTSQLVHAAAPIVLFLAIEATTTLIRQMQRERQQALVANQQPITLSTDTHPTPNTETQQHTTGLPLFTQPQPSATTGVTTETIPIPLVNPTTQQPPRVSSDDSNVSSEPTTDSPAPTAAVETPETMAPTTVNSAPPKNTVSKTGGEAKKATTPKKTGQHRLDMTIPEETPDGQPLTVPDKIRYILNEKPDATVDNIADTIPYPDRKYLRRVANQEIKKRTA